MNNTARLQELGLFDKRVPRYTSYPTAPVFTPGVNAKQQTDWIAALDPTVPISVYVHIPFCERLCWFCACRTQGTTTLNPVISYLDVLLAELDLLRTTLPAGIQMGRLHWGGGTPTILSPDMIQRLSDAIKSVIPPADVFEFSVEVDPTLVDAPKINALQEQGMNRASIGIQDFSLDVQAAIGRKQSFETTLKCVRMLQDAGISSLNTDLVYGLPHQTTESIKASVEQVLELDPDRLALFGYAHVPWMAKRQKLIKEEHLPDDQARYELASVTGDMLQDAGYIPIGIDHFAKPGDGLSRAMANGSLRRNFQGYTEDNCPTLLGIGASSISSFAQGYVQNAAGTNDYTQQITAGNLAGSRGHSHSDADHLHARAIEMLMCNFAIDLPALKGEFGDLADGLNDLHRDVHKQFAPFISRTDRALTINPEGHTLTRIIAACYDAYQSTGATYSRAS